MIHMKYTSTNVNKLEGDGREGEWILGRQHIHSPPLSSEVQAHETASGGGGGGGGGASSALTTEATPQSCLLSNPKAHYAVPSLGPPYAVFLISA